MKIAIIGFGKEGVAAANYFGEVNDVTVIDDKSQDEVEKEYFRDLKVTNLRFFFNKTRSLGEKFDLVVRSPSVRPDHKIIRELTRNGAKVTSGTQIFFDKCPAPIIGVTGTKGKGTCATLIYEILKTQNKNVHLAGNIGTAALSVLPTVKKSDIAILELSSFQLIDLKASPHVAVVLMITSEHLDWHKNKQEYLKSKESIVKSQKSEDFAVINADFATSFDFAKKTKAKSFFFSTQKKTNGIYVKGDGIVSEIRGFEKIIELNEILLSGRHNWQNAMAATAVAKLLNVPIKNITKVLKTFRGLEHRLQYLGMIGGISFYNDSYSTIPETTIAAIEAIDGPKVLILGGSSKGSNFTDLTTAIVDDQSVESVVLVGLEAKRIKDGLVKTRYMGKIIMGAKNMREIVKAAYTNARPDSSVILSPACASFDMFKNYQDRGQQFIKEVKKLGDLKW